jgi:5-methylcytosine-specific restriction endonuclease McrA
LVGSRRRTARNRLKPGVISKQREYRLARTATRDEFLANYKMSRGCADCGYDKHPRALDFNHLKDKSFNIGGNGRETKWAAILAEIEKCEVVCSNCHRIRTDQREQEKKVGQLADALLSA